mgnify:FL=1
MGLNRVASDPHFNFHFFTVANRVYKTLYTLILKTLLKYDNQPI